MIKRFALLICMTAMLMTFASCGGKKEAAKQETAPAGEIASVGNASQELVVTPAMEVEGEYGNERYIFDVHAEDGNKLGLSVIWTKSKSEYSTWEMSGDFNSETGIVEYTDCVRTDYKYNKEGIITSENVAYENGTGNFKIYEIAEDGYPQNYDKEERGAIHEAVWKNDMDADENELILYENATLPFYYYAYYGDIESIKAAVASANAATATDATSTDAE